MGRLGAHARSGASMMLTAGVPAVADAARPLVGRMNRPRRPGAPRRFRVRGHMTLTVGSGDDDPHIEVEAVRIAADALEASESDAGHQRARPSTLPEGVEHPVDFTASDGTVWRRFGACNNCGECCRAGDPVASGKPRDLEWFTEAELADPERVPGVCPLWRREGRCAGHGDHPFYLAGCHLYPQHPDDLKATPSCSYTFTLIP